MIRYNIKELMARKEFKEKRKITLKELSKSVGISRITLYRMANPKGDFSTRTEYIEKLCGYFGCSCDDLMTILPDPVKEDTQEGDEKVINP
jgi:putative transcriptional regulator